MASLTKDAGDMALNSKVLRTKLTVVPLNNLLHF